MHTQPQTRTIIQTATPDAQRNTLNRRHWLQLAGAASTVWAAPTAWSQGTRQAQDTGRLVVVFLRGAYDGLSALVPHGDADYYAIRPTIALPKPDGTVQTTLALDATFGLHPALAPLLPFWQQGVLAAIPAAGSPDATRSHFDAQHHWEIGVPGRSGNGAGWMNTLAGFKALAPEGTAQAATNSIAIGVGEANPQILSGASPVQLIPKGEAAKRQGALGDERTRDAVMRLYAGDDSISKAFRSGADSRMQTAQTLSAPVDASMQANAMGSREMQAANNGAGEAKGLLLDAQHLGTLMRQDRKLKLGFLSAGGWDTHANQGSVTGALSNNLGSLAGALVQLRRDFSQPRDVVVVCSEFGRTSAENGTRGTDHGHGNTLWVMGNQVNGGRWHGKWTGLASANLHEARDLPVHHDFRGVLAQVLRSSMGLTASQIDPLFPGYRWDAGLDGLMRA
jgi:uncharacterized protein (DUF1501 family)